MKQQPYKKVKLSTVELRRPWLVFLFYNYAKRFVSKNFHALHILKDCLLPAYDDESAIIAFNHPSWWDPLTCMTISHLFPDHHHYAPIEAIALEQYPFFKHLGIFPIDSNSPKGLRQLLQAASSIFNQKNNILWISPQGNFKDARLRPPSLKSGIGAVCASLQKKGKGSVTPLAIEYVFRTEKKPEIFINFGSKIDFTQSPDHTAHDWTSLIENSMEKTQDQLAEKIIQSDLSHFSPLFQSHAGTHPIYDLWRRFSFALQGKTYHREHAATVRDQN